MTRADHDPLAVEFEQVIEKLGSEIGDRAVRRGLAAEREKLQQLAQAAANGIKEIGQQAESSAAAVAEIINEAKAELAYVTEECADVAARLEELGDGELASAVNAKVSAIDEQFAESRVAVEAVLAKTRDAIVQLEEQAQSNSDKAERATERLGKALDQLAAKATEAAQAETMHRRLLTSTTSDLRALGANLQTECTKAADDINGEIRESRMVISSAAEALRPQLEASIAEADHRIEGVSDRLVAFESELQRLQARLLFLGIPLVLVCAACAIFAAVRG